MGKARGISRLGTVVTFASGRACSDTLFHVLSRAFGHPQLAEEHACMPFAGGIAQHGYQCGMLWGAAIAAGAEAHRRFGAGPRAEAATIRAARQLVAAFRAREGTVDCLDITDIDKSSTRWQLVKYFLLKGGTVGCFRMAARYAPAALAAIEAAFAAGAPEPPAPPVSCAALLAEKLGLAPLQRTMVAGLAGGLGLAGGACGALGAAIWAHARGSGARGDKRELKDPRTLALIERVLERSDYELECAAIVGRRFDSVADHAAHVAGGGCAELIETLAAPVNSGPDPAGGRPGAGA